jgi:hypothetical protein
MLAAIPAIPTRNQLAASKLPICHKLIRRNISLSATKLNIPFKAPAQALIAMPTSSIVGTEVPVEEVDNR